jgi:hypothetical protein
MTLVWDLEFHSIAKQSNLHIFPAAQHRCAKLHEAWGVLYIDVRKLLKSHFLS